MPTLAEKLAEMREHAVACGAGKDWQHPPRVTPDVLAALVAVAEAAFVLIEAQAKLLVSYRIQGRPSDKTLDEIAEWQPKYQAARLALARACGAGGTGGK